jgi:hypothetical protein
MSAAAMNMAFKMDKATAQPPSIADLLSRLAVSPTAAGLGLLASGNSSAAGSDHSCLATMSVETLIAADGTVSA